ncbi:MAG: hypothetical protein AAFR98_13000, partial [Pseudomonadota bacterium]
MKTAARVRDNRPKCAADARLETLGLGRVGSGKAHPSQKELEPRAVDPKHDAAQDSQDKRRSRRWPNDKDVEQRPANHRGKEHATP